MKRFLSILLSIMMILSSVSYAVPTSVGTFDTAVETQLPLDELFDEEENLSESATLAATDTTEYGELIVRFDMESITAGTNYTDVLHGTAGANVNGLSVFGGEIGTGSNKDVSNGDPFLYDGNRSGQGRHTSVVGAQDASGNKYLQLTGAGTNGYFGMRDYNGSGFAKTGHYILTFDVLNADVSEFTGAFFHNSAESIMYTVPVVSSDANGDWTTLAVSLDDNASIGTCNYMFITTSIASGATAAIDNITLWWVPTEVSINVTHDVEGILDDGTFTVAGGIKTAEELEAVFDPEGKFATAGYYLAGLRDENGVISDSTVLDESGKSFTAVWDKLNILSEYSSEFSSSTALNNPTSFTRYPTPTYSNGCMVFNVTSAISNPYFEIPGLGSATDSKTIPVNGFDKLLIRVRFTGSSITSTIKFPNGYFTTDAVTAYGSKTYRANNGTIAANNGKWVVYELDAVSVFGNNTNTLNSVRLDADQGWPAGTVVEFDYIRFMGKDKDAGDNVLINADAPDYDFNSFKVVFDSTTTAQSILDLVSSEAYEGAYVPDGLVATDGTVLSGSDLIAGYVDDQDVLTVNWEKSEYIGDYGELVFEVNFEKLAAGAAGTAFSYDMQSSGAANGNFLSNFGGKVNPAYSVSESEIYVRNESGKANIVIKEDAEHGKYVEYTITSNGTSKNVWDFTPYTSGKKFADKDGYFILTADYKQPKDGHLIQTHWNRSHNAEDMVKVAAKETYPAANTWGEYRSIYDADSIGKSTHNPPIASVTEIDHILLYNASQAAGETYAFDNVRLWWVPKTVNVTVPAGTNTGVSAFTTAIAPTATVADLMALVPAGSMTLKGLSLTEGGELLEKTAVLGFVENTTLYPVWMAGQTVTVDMGDNTVATPVSMAVKATTTVGDVLAKMVDEGDKKLVGLSRTEGGAVLSATELINPVDEVTTLYAIWEDYEYLTYYSVGFDFNDIGRYRVNQNNAKPSVTLNADGTLTLKAVPKDGYTATWDQQIYVETFNASTALPAGVVSQIAVRMRYRNVPAASASYTTENRGTNTFNPADNPAYIHVWNTSGSHTGGFDRREKNIVDGQWFTCFFDVSTVKADSGISQFRFDTPYPMPAGMEVDFDFIRFVGDNDNELIPDTAVAPELMPNFSTDFDEGNDYLGFVSWRKADENGNVVGFEEYRDGVVGRNSAYTGDNYENFITWNEDGYVTLNFDASEEAKASAAANGYTAAIYDSVAYFKPLDGTVALDAGALNKVQMRVRFRNIPSAKQDLWRHDNSSVVTNYNPAALFYFHAMNNLDAIGTAGITSCNFVTSSNVVNGSYAPNEWFVVDLPASFFKADTNVLDLLRLDLNDAMPDGSKMDIDYIHFYGVEDVIESVGPAPVEPEVPEDKEPGKGDVVRATYSLEFNESAEGASLTSWKNADGTYKTDDGVNGDKGPGFNSAYIGEGTEDYITWNEDGYVTLNFDASEEAKAAAEAQGMTAALYDPSLYVGTLDKEAYIAAGSFKELKIRMRLRNFPADGTMVYAPEKWGSAGSTEFNFTTYPVYFHYQYEIGALGTSALKSPKINDTCTYTEGSYVRDEWFEVTIPAAFFEADVKPIETLRINLPDWTPDGAKIDIDYIRFIGNDADYSPATKNEVSLRVSDPAGIRFKATMSSATSVVANEYGWVAADAEKVSEDELAVGAENVLVGYGRENGVDVKSFFEQDDEVKTFTLVIKNIKKEYADRKMSVKPFVNVDGEYIYGDAVTKSVKEIAVSILAADAELEEGAEGKLSADTVAYLNEIVEYSNN